MAPPHMATLNMFLERLPRGLRVTYALTPLFFCYYFMYRQVSPVYFGTNAATSLSADSVSQIFGNSTVVGTIPPEGKIVVNPRNEIGGAAVRPLYNKEGLLYGYERVEVVARKK